MISKKVVLIGDFSTGKTSLIRRFVDNAFSDTYLSTLGVKISRKTSQIHAQSVQNLIWDIEGGTPSKPLNKSYLQGAHGAIIVCDVTREESIEHIQDYFETNSSMNAEIPCIVALNKCDLMSSEVGEALLEILTQRFSAISRFVLTSAKSGEGVETMFEQLGEAMLERN